MHDQFNRIDAVLKTSRVSIAELAEVSGMQKCTMLGWKSGKHKPDALRFKIVNGYIDLIAKACAVNKLPLPLTPTQQKDRAWRVKAIKTILAEVRQSG